MYMKQQFFVLLMALVCVISACNTAGSSAEGGKASEKVVEKEIGEQIKDVEAQLQAESKKAFNPELAKKAVAAYSKFAEMKPKDPNTPEYLFKGAEIYRSLRNYDKAVAAYNKIYDEYKDFDKLPQTLFLLGFTYENEIKNLDKAKELYEKFLAEYPEHELADDVQFSVKNLGVPAEDIIKNFERKEGK